MRLVERDGSVAIDLTDPVLRLTAEQQAACATDREIVLTAGAGAGKTHTLSVRYAALQLRQALAGESEIASVLVLTFTERAAAEMAERCQERLFDLALAARAVAKPDLVDRLEVLASQVDRAAITTFHGLCASILREFPRNAGATEGATVLSEVEGRRLAERQIELALERMIATRASDLTPLLDAFETRSALVEAACAALDRRVTLRRTLDEHARGAITIEALAAAASPTAEQARGWLRDVGLPTLTALTRLTAPSGGGSVVTDVLRPALAARADDGGDPLATWSRYREVLDSLLTDAGRFRALDHASVLGRRSQWPDETRFRLAKEAARSLGDLRRADWVARAQQARRLPTSADRVLLETLAPLARLVLDAEEGLAAHLDHTRTITFEEMQSRAIAMVTTDPAVRATLRRRHRFLMVDELQDTDAAQWSLVRALARERSDMAEDRLFAVGDPKQAIYAFRGGDVRVFRRATEELGSPPLSLTTNFRSRNAIVAWCNALFPHVFGGGASPWEVAYTPMTAASAEGGGEVVLLHGEDLGPERQAAVVADWIASELRDPVWSDRDRFPTAPIAVLLRARTHQASFEDALRRRGVPYVVAGGTSFWARREVIDVVLALSTVARGDPISTVGFLRSSLGGLTDQEVSDGGGTLEGEAAARIEGWRMLAREAPASAVVDAIGATARPFLAVTDPTGQAEANVRRLVQIVASLDALGIDAVADRLSAEVERGSRESEAVVTPGEPRVVVCTVHGAKGLEFPVVIVPHLDARPRVETGPLRIARLDGDDDWAIATRVSDPDADVQTRVAPGRLAAIDQVLRQEADAEERRLFYVAATRAREKLVLVGADQGAAEPGARRTWMQLVLEHLPRSTTLLAVSDPGPGPDPDPASPPARIPPRPQRDDHPPLSIAASTLDLFHVDPQRWYRTVVLGIAEEMSLPRRRSLALHAARGRAVHRALERGLADTDEEIARHWIAIAAAAGATRDEADDALPTVLAHVARCRASPMLRAILDAPGVVEVPFRVTHRHVTLHGRIDRLWLHPDGPIVVDWKTERPPADLDPAAHRLQLVAYGWAADRVAREAGAARVRRGLLFFTAAGTGVPVDFDADEIDTIPHLLESVAAAVATQGIASSGAAGAGAGAGASDDSVSAGTHP